MWTPSFPKPTWSCSPRKISPGHKSNPTSVTGNHCSDARSLICFQWSLSFSPERCAHKWFSSSGFLSLVRYTGTRRRMEWCSNEARTGLQAPELNSSLGSFASQLWVGWVPYVLCTSVSKGEHNPDHLHMLLSTYDMLASYEILAKMMLEPPQHWIVSPPPLDLSSPSISSPCTHNLLLYSRAVLITRFLSRSPEL